MLDTGKTPRLPKYRARAHNGQIEACNRLWRSVLCQQIKDIYDRDDRVRVGALRWLVSKDYETVCDLALIEPESLRDQLANLATLPLNIAKQYGNALIRFVSYEEE